MALPIVLDTVFLIFQTFFRNGLNSNNVCIQKPPLNLVRRQEKNFKHVVYLRASIFSFLFDHISNI